jgi:NTE family protein
MTALSEVIKSSGASTVERAAEFTWDGNDVESGIGIALSGGGFRAMLFHGGALLRLNELGLLSRASRISSVSGGSIAAALLAKAWPQLGPSPQGIFQKLRQEFLQPLVRFSQSKIDVVDSLTGTLPWTSAAQEVAKSFESLMGPDTLQALPDTPRFVLCATNLQTGVLWRFSKPYAGDYVVGRISNPTFKLAQAAAASSAFPPVLSPLVLEPSPGSFSDWPTKAASGPAPRDLTGFREKVVLTDGGVYDNHGIEPTLKRYMTIFVSDGGAPFARKDHVSADWISQLRRVADVTENQVRALRRRDLIDRLRVGNAAYRSGALKAGEVRARERMGAYWGIDTDPENLKPDHALDCSLTLINRLAHLPTRLSDPGEPEAQQLVNWGYAVCDRSVRINYCGAVALVPTEPAWPYPEVPMV